jgi:hypothetical protein
MVHSCLLAGSLSSLPYVPFHRLLECSWLAALRVSYLRENKEKEAPIPFVIILKEILGLEL